MSTRSPVIVTAAVVALLAVSALFLEEGARASQQAPAEPIVEGRVVFEQKSCARCHSVWESESLIGPDLGARGTEWRDVMWFAGALWNHTPEMGEQMRVLKIERPALSPDDVQKLAAYLFYVKFVGRPGDAEQGREVFDRALCWRCHQLGGYGGTVGPRLDDLKEYMSLYFLAHALWNHGPRMARKLDELKLGHPSLDADDVTHLVTLLSGGKRTFGPLEVAYARAGTPRAGEVLFRDKGCIRCHAVAGKGAETGPDLGQERSLLNLANITAALWNHGPGMWERMEETGLPFPTLTDRELSDLVAYLAFIQYLGPRGDAARGGEVFRDKDCSRCHAVGGEGSRVGPDLVESNASQSALTWTSAVWNHAAGMEKELKENHRAWPRFEGDEMRDLVAFLRSRRKSE